MPVTTLTELQDRVHTLERRSTIYYASTATQSETARATLLREATYLKSVEAKTVGASPDEMTELTQLISTAQGMLLTENQKRAA